MNPLIRSVRGKTADCASLASVSHLRRFSVSIEPFDKRRSCVGPARGSRSRERRCASHTRRGAQRGRCGHPRAPTSSDQQTFARVSSLSTASSTREVRTPVERFVARNARAAGSLLTVGERARPPAMDGTARRSTRSGGMSDTKSRTKSSTATRTALGSTTRTNAVSTVARPAAASKSSRRSSASSLRSKVPSGKAPLHPREEGPRDHHRRAHRRCGGEA